MQTLSNGEEAKCPKGGRYTLASTDVRDIPAVLLPISVWDEESSLIGMEEWRQPEWRVLYAVISKPLSLNCTRPLDQAHE